MADLASVTAVGESLVALLNGKRDTTLPPDLDIRQASTAGLKGGPQHGLTITCIQMAEAADSRLAPPLPDELRTQPPFGLELRFLIAAAAPDAAEEQALMAWAMTTIARNPLLMTMPGSARVTLAPTTLPFAELATIWRALGLDYRLSQVVTARGLVLAETAQHEPLVIDRPAGRKGWRG